MVASTLALLCFLLWTSNTAAQSSFYQGKTIRLVAGTPAGSVYDLYARMVAQFIPKHIPGAPNIVVQNMPGIGRPIVATPGIPADRVKILREAFMKTVKDTELLDDAKKKRLELDPVSGEDLESLGKEIIAQPPEVVERMKKLLGT
jgi:tripartite-type tricarboxylate transporter receptor subunit TctC